MNCPDCNADMGDPVDTTYSNIKTHRAMIWQHTGDIYYCENCDETWINDFLEGRIYPWTG